MESNHNNPIGHEVEDANVRGIVYAGIGLMIGILIASFIVYGVFQYMKAHAPTVDSPNPMAQTDQQIFPPAPRIEARPAEELNELRLQEERMLTTYGWTDKASGVVRIPIERAMQIQMERGFATRSEAAK